MPTTTLDLRVRRVKITNFEQIDLGAGNILEFDPRTLADVTGSGNVLFVRGAPGAESEAVVRRFTPGEADPWIYLGEDVHEGAIFDGYLYKTPEGRQSVYQIWVEVGAVKWNQGATGTEAGEVLKGSRENDFFDGLAGDDRILLRWGGDDAAGGEGADAFIIDSRYVNAGDRPTILDFTPSEGDSITFRFFDQPRKITSVEDLEFYVDSGFASIAPAANDTLEVSFFGLDENFGSGDETFIGTRSSDSFDGGAGNDRFLLRFEDDTATGGDDADMFVFDARYIGSDGTHTVTDIDFTEGDVLELRFFTNSKISIASNKELRDLDKESCANVRSSGDGVDVGLTNSNGDIVQIRLLHSMSA